MDKDVAGIGDGGVSPQTLRVIHRRCPGDNLVYGICLKDAGHALQKGCGLTTHIGNILVVLLDEVGIEIHPTVVISADPLPGAVYGHEIHIE